MSTLSEAYQNHPLHLHHIIPLDFASLRTVPDSHSWPQSKDPSSLRVHSNPQLSIPSIDLSDPDATNLIGNACETWGIFQLTNHGIPITLMKETEREARRFFDLSMRRKLKALRSPGGATGYGIARITPFFDKYMWHEGFTIMGSPIDHAREVWPSNYKLFCDAMEEYQTKMNALAKKIIRLIFKYLGISDREIMNLVDFDQTEPTFTPTCSTALQLNCYPPCPDPSRVIGLAPHTDTFLLTILHQSLTHGLQIFKDGAGWVPVSPVTGALVVNIGDLFHILSNARFPNVLHRVVVNQTRRRLSLAYFYGPPPDFCVWPYCKFLSDSDSSETPHYRSVVVKDYISMKAKNLENALSFIRI